MNNQWFSKVAVWLVIALVLFTVFKQFETRPGGSSGYLGYSEFLEEVRAKRIKTATIQEGQGGTEIVATTNDDRKIKTTATYLDRGLVGDLISNGVKFDVKPREEGSLLMTLLVSWGPMLLLIGVWVYFMRQMQGGGKGGAFSFGKSKARMLDENNNVVTFADVAGCDEAKEEVKEVVDFLKDPQRFQKLGGRIPRGLLLVGPPGTGKTLLAKGIAGEAKVPFFSISGSDFVEMFVGVGAARVRDMFENAKKNAPCIIFIDELDAIGRSRGGPMMIGGHDEREQTLNQLLTEMDGFDTSVGVVVMAATNRPEVLDKALLRSGRFDRQIVVDKPDLQDRMEILKLHTKAMTLNPTINIEIIAKRTPGLVGADLANIANEAAIMAVRAGHKKVEMQDFEAAIDRILAGPEKKNRVLNPNEKKRVAYHEAGHAMVAEHVPTGQPVHKISIIPRGVSALGFTLQLPVEESFLSTEYQLKDQIAILLGGRIAEEITLGSISTGAQNDLEKASDIARSMVCNWGMSKKLGPLTYGKRQQLQFLESEVSEARIIDTEIMALIKEGEKRAQEIITTNRAALEKLATLLQEKEVINREEMLALLESK